MVTVAAEAGPINVNRAVTAPANKPAENLAEIHAALLGFADAVKSRSIQYQVIFTLTLNDRQYRQHLKSTHQIPQIK
jgi:hypothetical protein